MTTLRRYRHAPPMTLLLLTAVGLVYTLFTLVAANASEPGRNYVAMYFRHPLLLLLNALPVVLLLAAVWLAVGVAWVAALVPGAVIFLLSAANYFKILFRDDPLLCSDLFLLKEGYEISKGYEVVFPPLLYVWMLAVAGATAFLFFWGRGRPSAPVRLLTLSGAVLVSAGLFWYVYQSKALFQRFGGELGAHPSQTEAVLARGAAYPFLYSFGDAFDLAPSGYNAGETAALLAGYTDGEIPREKQVSIVSLQLEAYVDLSLYDVQGLSPGVYKKFHALEAESVAGNLITDIFAGGTAETEWAILTGGNQHGDFLRPTDSVAWYLKSQGYTTTGGHPSHEWFYDRAHANPSLGFDSYLFMENYFQQFTGPKEDVLYDDTFFPLLIDLLDDHFTASDAPLFSFNVTYQGHGPYNTDRTWWGSSFCTGDYSAESRNILNNYFYVLQNTMDNVTRLVDYLRKLDKPVVLLVYGDHKPWLGNGNSVYEELGINLDTSTPEGFRNYYGTRYLMWANPAAKAALGDDFTGVGSDLSPCFLMSALFDRCGWDGSAYLQAQRETAKALPVLHTTGWYLENGVYTQSLTAEGAALAERFDSLSRYDRSNFPWNDAG